MTEASYLSQNAESMLQREKNMALIPLTVVVITKNEELNIDPCLKSVHGWADELIVVDDESTDRTVEIAQKFYARIFHRKMDNEGKHRNWAHAQARNEWVLILDADEYVTEELKLEITQAVKSPEFQAYSIPLRNFIGTYWVRYGGWYPAGKLRLFRKSCFEYEEVGVHPRTSLFKSAEARTRFHQAGGKLPQQELQACYGKCGHLTKDIVHKGYPDLEHFLGSLNRQTTLEAQKWIETGRQMSLGRATWRTIDRFFRRFFGKRGYKDGFYGFVIAYFDSLYQSMSYMKYIEMKKKQNKT